MWFFLLLNYLYWAGFFPGKYKQGLRALRFFNNVLLTLVIVSRVSFDASWLSYPGKRNCNNYYNNKNNTEIALAADANAKLISYNICAYKLLLTR